MYAFLWIWFYCDYALFPDNKCTLVHVFGDGRLFVGYFLYRASLTDHVLINCQSIALSRRLTVEKGGTSSSAVSIKKCLAQFLQEQDIFWSRQQMRVPLMKPSASNETSLIVKLGAWIEPFGRKKTRQIILNKLAKLRRHASRVHFALIHFG